MNENSYKKHEMELILFSDEDVIVTSNGMDNNRTSASFLSVLADDTDA